MHYDLIIGRCRTFIFDHFIVDQFIVDHFIVDHFIVGNFIFGLYALRLSLKLKTNLIHKNKHPLYHTLSFFFSFSFSWVNFINILLGLFSPILFCQKGTKQNCNLEKSCAIFYQGFLLIVKILVLGALNST